MKGSANILKIRVQSERADVSNVDDVFATTESEPVASSGEAADSGARASGTTIAAATPVAKSVGEAQPLEIAMELQDPNSKRGECYATAMWNAKHQPSRQSGRWCRFLRVNSLTEW